MSVELGGEGKQIAPLLCPVEIDLREPQEDLCDAIMVIQAGQVHWGFVAAIPEIDLREGLGAQVTDNLLLPGSTGLVHRRISLIADRVGMGILQVAEKFQIAKPGGQQLREGLPGFVMSKDPLGVLEDRQVAEGAGVIQGIQSLLVNLLGTGAKQPLGAQGNASVHNPQAIIRLQRGLWLKPDQHPLLRAGLGDCFPLREFHTPPLLAPLLIILQDLAFHLGAPKRMQKPFRPDLLPALYLAFL